MDAVKTLVGKDANGVEVYIGDTLYCDCCPPGEGAEVTVTARGDDKWVRCGGIVWRLAHMVKKPESKCPRCGGDGVDPAPDPKVLDAALCSGSIPVVCDECSGAGTVESEDADSTTARGAQD